MLHPGMLHSLEPSCFVVHPSRLYCSCISGGSVGSTNSVDAVSLGDLEKIDESLAGASKAHVGYFCG